VGRMSGDSQIVSDLKQLKNVSSEIKRMGVVLKDLRSRKVALEEKILTYLNKTRRDGAKTQDIVVMAKERTKRPAKPKEEKEQDITEILRNAGVRDTSLTYQAILEAMKGEEQKKQAIVLKEMKK
jgi:hypothetical protein